MSVKASLKLPLTSAEGTCPTSFAVTACFHCIICFAAGFVYLASTFSAKNQLFSCQFQSISSYFSLTEDEWWRCYGFGKKRGFIDVILQHSTVNTSLGHQTKTSHRKHLIISLCIGKHVPACPHEQCLCRRSWEDHVQGAESKITFPVHHFC